MSDKPRGNNLVIRSVSGLVIALVVLGAAHLGGAAWIALVMVLAMLSLAEYYRLLSTQFKLSRGIGYLSALAVIWSSAEGFMPVSTVMILSLTIYAVFMLEIVRRQTLGASFAIWNTGGILSGILFIIVPWTCLILLRDMPTGRLYLIALFLCTWSCDTVAYLVGTKWGRVRLCEKISPKKTLEGFIGGAVGSIMMVSLIMHFLQQPPFPLLIIGIICAFAGQLSDLAASLIKRETGVKDASNLIPGHGGVLDRFDSILLNGLLVYLFFGIILA